MKTDSREVTSNPRTVSPPPPPVATPDQPVVATESEDIALLPDDVAAGFRSRWDMIQSGFVDDPRRAVQQAGELVEEALGKLTAVFTDKRKNLQRGETVATEELRQTLRHYRLLLNHLC